MKINLSTEERLFILAALRGEIESTKFIAGFGTRYDSKILCLGKLKEKIKKTLTSKNK